MSVEEDFRIDRKVCCVGAHSL